MLFRSYQPDHYSIKAAAAQDYDAFYDEEMKYRRLLHYPPAYRFMTVQLSSRDEASLEKTAQEGAWLLKELGKKWGGYSVIGPSSPPVGKRKDVFFQMLYVKGNSLAVMIRLKDRLEEWAQAQKENFYLQFDIR